MYTQIFYFNIGFNNFRTINSYSRKIEVIFMARISSLANVHAYPSTDVTRDSIVDRNTDINSRARRCSGVIRSHMAMYSFLNEEKRQTKTGRRRARTDR